MQCPYSNRRFQKTRMARNGWYALLVCTSVTKSVHVTAVTFPSYSCCLSDSCLILYSPLL
jgi:hypothetical protein